MLERDDTLLAQGADLGVVPLNSFWRFPSF